MNALFTKKTILKLFVLMATIMLMVGCSMAPPIKPVLVKSPLGIYKTNTAQKYWLTILQNENYLLCSPESCFKGKYEKVPVNYGVILLDFYSSKIGLALEKLTHGMNQSEEYYEAMKKLREMEFRANDQAFNIGDCAGVPCVGLGHRRDGVKFFKIENFDEFWRTDKE